MQPSYNYPPTYSGDTLPAINITLQDAAGTPLNLTGAEIHVQFRRNVKFGELVADLALGDGITATSLSQGQFTIDAIQQQWKPDTYWYDVQVTLAGTIRTYLEGKVIILQDVTQ